ncbi:cobalamin biosynthesis protein CbiM [Methanolacinia petrolearia DSM 11571]|uniref:Putative cobalt transport protein CbiM n=1 Tax=Methanolacinia petrolearia (strain DSM 11571 / OCM 486 / SEBR 4847) TaxID=679926 RepID=E1RHY0_METP4|nr:energy-coupling factor ABC transporter permease [Methanolacinia petrolearia]ADN36518.1 cobalamin biosynthesis protein CbiM [Methanolacinia petrolearia DSM 11571]
MHIMEGFLPSPWWEIWWILALPCLIYGCYKLKKLMEENREVLPLLGVAGGFIFVLSALKLPSVTGSCSHPTGTALSAISFGPWITTVLGFIVLLFQALFLAHGGITTLGANMFSMAIVGPFVGYWVFKGLDKINFNFFANVFVAAFLCDLITYCVTSLELALAFPATAGGLLASFAAFLGVFAITQVPLAIVEGFVFVVIFKYIIILKPELLVKMKVMTQEKMNKVKGGIEE